MLCSVVMCDVSCSMLSYAWHGAELFLRPYLIVQVACHGGRCRCQGEERGVGGSDAACIEKLLGVLIILAIPMIWEETRQSVVAFASGDLRWSCIFFHPP